jgi:hypothetical protein
MNESNEDRVHPSNTTTVKTGCGKLYVTVTYEDELTCKPIDVRLSLGKAGGCARSMTASVGIALGCAMKAGYDLQDCVRKFKGILCNEPVHGGAQSCADAVGVAIERLLASWAKNIAESGKQVASAQSEPTAEVANADA